MPTFTLALTDPAVARLQPLVARYNADLGVDLSLQDWITLHLQEIAIGPELAAKLDQLRQQSEADLTAAVIAEKARLLADLTPK